MGEQNFELRSEDSVPYVVGDVGDEGRIYICTLDYDGDRAFLRKWRTVGSSEGDCLTWRFVTTDSEVIVVKPVPLGFCNRPVCVPDKIESIWRAVSPLIRWVHGMITTPDSPSRHLDQKALIEEAREKTGKAARDKRNAVMRGLQEQAMKQPDKLRELEERHKRDHPKLWQDAESEDLAESAEIARLSGGPNAERERYYREASLYTINQFIGQHTGALPVAITKPGKGGYTQVQRNGVIKRLTDPKSSGAVKLERIRTFIERELFKPFGEQEAKAYAPGFSQIRGTSLSRLVEFIGRQTNDAAAFKKSVMMAYHGKMPVMFKDWVEELAQARKASHKEVENFLVERIHFVAKCQGRNFVYCYPVEDIIGGPKGFELMDQEDRAPYQVPVHNENSSRRVRGLPQNTIREDGAKSEESAQASLPSRVVFNKNFTEITFPADPLAVPLQMRASLRSAALKVLFEKWNEQPGQWKDWEWVKREARITGSESDPMRFFVSRKEAQRHLRPYFEQIFGAIIEVKESDSLTGNTYQVRLRQTFTYQVS